MNHSTIPLQIDSLKHNTDLCNRTVWFCFSCVPRQTNEIQGRQFSGFRNLLLGISFDWDRSVARSLCMQDCGEIVIYTGLWRDRYVYRTVARSLCIQDCGETVINTGLWRDRYEHGTVTRSLCTRDCGEIVMYTGLWRDRYEHGTVARSL
jgi:hypothetical protein